MPQPPASSSPKHSSVLPGDRVSITQQIPQRDEVWTITVEGNVVKTEQKKTGSWYAHAKDDKLWLDRLTLRKDDGEIVVCILDQFSHVEVLPKLKEEAATEEVQSDAVEDAADEAGNGETEDAEADVEQSADTDA